MSKFLLGFATGALVALALLVLLAPRPSAPVPAPGWYQPPQVEHYT